MNAVIRGDQRPAGHGAGSGHHSLEQFRVACVEVVAAQRGGHCDTCSAIPVTKNAFPPANACRVATSRSSAEPDSWPHRVEDLVGVGDQSGELGVALE